MIQVDEHRQLVSLEMPCGFLPGIWLMSVLKQHRQTGRKISVMQSISNAVFKLHGTK